MNQKSTSQFVPQTQGDETNKAVKVTPLLRAKDLAAPVPAWAAPDLQAEMLKASREAFDRVLHAARAEVAEDLERMRQATLSTATAQGNELGYKAGYEQGYEKGYQQAQQEVRAMLQAEFDEKNLAWQQEKDLLLADVREHWQSLVVSLTQTLHSVEDALLEDLVWLVTQWVERLIGLELTLSPDAVRRLVQNTLEQLPKIVYPLTIRVSSLDFSTLENLTIGHDGRTEVVADEQLNRGEVVIQSGHSEVTLKWKEVTRTLLDDVMKVIATRELSQHDADKIHE